MTDLNCNECGGEGIIHVGRGEDTWIECCTACNPYGDKPDEDFEYEKQMELKNG